MNTLSKVRSKKVNLETGEFKWEISWCKVP